MKQIYKTYINITYIYLKQKLLSTVTRNLN